MSIVYYLIGPAGAGKYTIGQALARASGGRLIDNHLINNPIFTLLRLDGKTPIPESAWAKIEVIRATVLDAAATLAPPDLPLILTNELYEDEPDSPRWFADVETMACRRGVPFRPILLRIDPEVLAGRITSPGRAERHKATDPARGRAGARRRLYGHHHPDALVLDVTTQGPDESVARILAAESEKN